MENKLIPYQATQCISASSVVVFAPHPDDEVFGCGGAILRHVAARIPVHVVIVSDGAFGAEGDKKSTVIATREAESHKAATILGYGEPEFWRLPDRGIAYGEALIQRIMATIELSTADLIYTPSLLEMHPDHRALAMCVIEAVRRAPSKPQLALYEVGVPLHPNLLLDISDLAERKKLAMECFASQNQQQRYDLDIAALNRYRTYTLPAEVTAAEAFILVSAEALTNDPFKLYQSEHQRQRALGLALDHTDLPLVSVIIRSMDRHTLSEALDSVALQTYAHIEVVVVNAKGAGHSSLSDWCGNFPLRFLDSEESLHRSRAGNKGLSNAQGDYLVFLDDDDWFTSEHISLLIEALLFNPDKKVAYSCVTGVNEQKQPIGNNFGQAFDRTRLLAGNYIPIHAVLFSRSIVDNGCRMDESLDLYEDWDFWLQAAAYGDFFFAPHFSAYYRIGGASGQGVRPNPLIEQQVKADLYKKWFKEWRHDDLFNIMSCIGRHEAKLNKAVAEHDGQILDLNQAVADRDGQIEGLNQSLAEREGQIVGLNQSMAEREAQIEGLNQAVAEREGQILGLNQAVAEREGQVVGLNQAVAERDGQIVALYSSNSWLVTRPLRLPSRLLRGEPGLVMGILRARLIHHGKRFYWRLPGQYRNQLLYWAYRSFSSIFKGMPHYEQWNAVALCSNTIPIDNQLLLIDTLPQAQQAEGDIAIHLHMYYHDLADEFSQYLKNMPFEYDLYVSVASVEGINVCRKAFADLAMRGKLVIEQAPNRGRDIAPMFCTFGSRLKNYSYIAHLHSKKSLYNNGATEGWRQYLCGNLLGSEKRIRSIFALMQGDAPCGIVYPQNYTLLPYQANTWLANKAAGAVWCARLGISTVPQGYFDFPAGSMFWVKGNALKPLFNTGITLNDFAEETGQLDGTFAHCLERLLVLSTLKQGYRPGIIKDLQNPTWSAWSFQQYLSRPFLYMVNQLADPTIKLIAFDIFDTLLCRPLLDAESVKAIVAERIGGRAGQLYLEYRSIAEGQAREAAGKDIGMTEIFARLTKLTDLSDETLTQIRDMEQKVEQATVKPRPEVVKLYQQALITGKPVVLISDMFLPRAVIESSLQNNGISGWTMLFLSNDIGLRKDTGELYEYVFSKYGISPAEMLMIGDNERSDLQIPCDKGVLAIHVLKPIEFARGLPRFHSLIETTERNGDINDELTLGLVLQQNFSAISYPQFDPYSLIQPSPFNIGYSLIGPLLVGMSEWLIEKALHDKIDRLYFLAREGQLIKQVYDLWTEGLDGLPQADYLVLSRRAVSVPMIETFADILIIAKATYYTNTISSFLYERYGLQLSESRWKLLENQVQWKRNSSIEVQNEQVDHLLPLLNALAAEIIANASLEYDALKHYLDDMGLEKLGRQAVVDIGYGGTIQNYLNRLVSTPVHGYYLMTDQRAVKVAEMHDVIIRGCFLEDIEPLLNPTPLMYGNSFLLEKFLSSSAAQVIHYELDQNNHLMTHYRELSSDEIEGFNFRAELQKGVIRYTHDAINCREQILSSYKPSIKVAKQLYDAFIVQQSKLESDLLQNIVLDDYYCGRGIVR